MPDLTEDRKISVCSPDSDISYSDDDIPLINLADYTENKTEIDRLSKEL